MSVYRDEQLKALEQTKQRREAAVGIFLDQQKTVEERLRAAPSCGSFSGKEEISVAASVLFSSEESLQVRIAALKNLNVAIGSDEQLALRVLELLEDEQESDMIKLGVINIFQAGQFSSAIISSLRAEYHQKLKNLLTKKDLLPAILYIVLESLAQEKDEFVQRMLLKGLESPKEARVEPDRAIQLLAYDLHAEYYPILKKIVEEPPTPAAKKEAIRALSGDQSAKSILVNTLTDKDENDEIRYASANSIAALDSSELYDHVRKILLDDEEDDEFRAALLNTASVLGDSNRLSTDEELQAKFSELSVASQATPLQKVTKRVLSKQLKSFRK